MAHLPFLLAIGYYKHLLSVTTDVNEKMSLYLYIGDAYRSLSKPNEALHYYEESKSIAVTTKNRKKEALIHDIMGRTYFSLQMFEDAETHVKQCLNIAKDLGEKEIEGAACTHLGNMYSALGKHQEAIVWYTNDLIVKRSLGNKKGEGLTYMQMGRSYQSLQNHEEALKFYRKHLEVAIGTKNRDEEMTAALNVGDVLQALCKYKEAIHYHDKALKIALELNKKCSQATSYRFLGYDYSHLAQYEKALECFQKSLDIARSEGMRSEEQNVYQGMGNVYYSINEYQEAIKYHQKHLNLAKDMGDKNGESHAYCNIGHVYLDSNNYNEALSCYKKSLAIAVDEETRQTIRGNIGNAYQLLGQYDDAIRYLEDVLHYAQETGNQFVEGGAYNNISVPYRYIGKYDKAMECCIEALVIGSKINDPVMEAAACGGMGACFRTMGNYDESIEYNKRRLEIAEKIGDRSREAHAYGGIGNAYQLKQNYEEAMKNLEKQLEITQEIGDRNGEKNACGNLGEVYRCLGEFEKAIKVMQNFLDKAKEAGDRRGEAQGYFNLGQCYYLLSYHDKKSGDECNSRSNLKESEKYLRASLDCYDYIYKNLGEKDDFKISILDTFILTYKMLSEVCNMMGKTEEALLVADRARGRALKDLLQTKYSIGEESLPIQDSLEYQDVERMLSMSGSSMLFFVVEHGGLVRTWLINEQVPLIYNQIMIEPVLSKKPNEGDEGCSDADVFEDWIKKAFDKMLVREGVQCEDRSLETETKAKANRCIYDEDISQDFQPLEFLYDVLVSPIQDNLAQEEIVIIPDGPLFKVPFAALRDSQNGSYLSDSKRIRLAPSLTSLNILNNTSKAGQYDKTGALIVGNPEVGEVMFRDKKHRFSRLPGAELEAKRISEIFGVSAVTGQQATKQAIKQRLCEGVAVIHFAAHGSTEGEIALSPGDTDGVISEESDYLLTIREVQEAGLRAQLVVLSCCHSGRGEIKSEGVVGMSRAFLAAGAHAVVASSWAIDDDATMEFMIKFYSHLKRGETVSTSLHHAMNEMKAGHYSEPRYWAPFFVIGEDVTLNV